jgi:hypothetical protein
MSSVLAIDQVCFINIGIYPWTDTYAKANSILGGVLLVEKQARQLLDGCQIKITELNPPQNKFHQGDKNLKCKWVMGTLVSGPLKGSKVVVVEDWLKFSSCICPTSTLVARGCQCGGS